MNDTNTSPPPFSNSPMPGAPLKRRWPALNRLNVLRTTSAVLAVFTIYLYVDVVVPTRQERAVCDRVVATLLETRDPVELNRAMAMLRTKNSHIDGQKG